MSETKEETRTVKAAARLCGVSGVWEAGGWGDGGKVGEGWGRAAREAIERGAGGRGLGKQAEERGTSAACIHQTHGHLQHVVPQCKVRKAIPEALHGFLGAAAAFEEGFFGIFEARHAGRWWATCEERRR